MGIQEIFQNLTSALDLQPIEIISMSVILALLVWLYKEFKGQYQTKKQLNTNKTESLAKNISKALSIAYNYRADSSCSEEFFAAVFSCYPYWDINKVVEIRIVIDDETIAEKEKVEKISVELYNQLDKISIQNRELSEIGSGYQALEFGLNHLKDVFYPVGQAMVTFWIIAGIFISLFGVEDRVIGTINLISILFIIMLPFALFALIKWGIKDEKN